MRAGERGEEAVTVEFAPTGEGAGPVARPRSAAPCGPRDRRQDSTPLVFPVVLEEVSDVSLERCHGLGLIDIVCATKKRKGVRWPLDRTNSWFSNLGQLRRNTD